MASRVAVVTGSNKGIGFSIVKGLAKKFNGTVYLTARNEQLGQSAVKEIEKLNLSVKFHQLDITSQQSINKLANHLKTNYNGLDILVNNAAIAYKPQDTTPIHLQAEELIKTNYMGQVNTSNALMELLRPGGRIVNIAARVGMLKFVKDESIRNKLKSDSLTLDELNDVMIHYSQLAQTGKHKQIALSPYNFSKAGVIALTRIQQRLFKRDSRNVLVNAVCPGLCKTDMTGQKGHLTADQGAETPLFLALLPDTNNALSGQFWADNKILDWTDMNWQWK